MNDSPIVVVVFDREEYLYNLIGVSSCYLTCRLVHSPQDTGDMFVFESSEGKIFRVNPSFSGFVGIRIS